MLRRAFLLASTGVLLAVPALAQEKSKKKATRESVIALRNRLAKASKDIRALAAEPMPSGLSAEQQKKYLAIVKEERAIAADGEMTAAQLTKEVDAANTKLDTLSELGEEQALKLQMAMDRLAKATLMVSNVLKKQSDTAQSIVQNLK